jgi:UPF0755 protein
MRTLGLAVAVLAVLAVLSAATSISIYERAGPLPRTAAVVVPRGSTRDVAEALKRAGVFDSPLEFEVAAYATHRDGPIHAAEFVLPAHASLREVLAVLRHAHPVEHRLTIAEGLTSAEIARALSNADAATGPVIVPAEGSVLPQTYEYERGTARSMLLERMQAAMRSTLASVWARRDTTAGLASPRALLVLASMVEHETAMKDERPVIAGVFINRLRLGMKLQSDPTVAYQAAGGLGPLDRRLTRADLATPGPTNTYVVAGLPDAPICAPGLASLLAAAHPAVTNSLYFVANGTGGHVFADSLSDHVAHVACYRHPETCAKSQ